MKNGHIHNSIPAEAVLKWVVKERDEAKDKVEQLTGYAKALELQIEDLQRELEAVKAAKEKAENENAGRMRLARFATHLKKAREEIELIERAL